MKPEDANVRQQELRAFLGNILTRLTADSGVSEWLKTASKETFEHFTEAPYQALAFGEAEKSLRSVWGVLAPAPVALFSRLPPRASQYRYQMDEEPSALRDELAPRDWRFVMSARFLKAIRVIDRKLQGRILEALGDLAREPMATKGDTVRPLSHDYSGMWRYRIGDYRLVYQPVPPNREILLVEFASRGSVY